MLCLIVLSERLAYTLDIGASDTTRISKRCTATTAEVYAEIFEYARSCKVLIYN
jgi:hypothetical protein